MRRKEGRKEGRKDFMLRKERRKEASLAPRSMEAVSFPDIPSLELTNLFELWWELALKSGFYWQILLFEWIVELAICCRSTLSFSPKSKLIEFGPPC